MNFETCEYMLMAGKNAAMHKMILEKNLPKPDMRLHSFSDLQLLLEEEVSELKKDIFKAVSGYALTQELLQAIQDEAGDVIAFASGIVAKALQEAVKLHGQQPSLWEECNNVRLD